MLQCIWRANWPLVFLSHRPKKIISSKVIQMQTKLISTGFLLGVFLWTVCCDELLFGEYMLWDVSFNISKFKINSYSTSTSAIKTAATRLQVSLSSPNAELWGSFAGHAAIAIAGCAMAEFLHWQLCCVYLRKNMGSDQGTPVGWAIKGIMLTSFIGIIINHYEHYHN